MLYAVIGALSVWLNSSICLAADNQPANYDAYPQELAVLLKKQACLDQEIFFDQKGLTAEVEKLRGQRISRMYNISVVSVIAFALTLMPYKSHFSSDEDIIRLAFAVLFGVSYSTIQVAYISDRGSHSCACIDRRNYAKIKRRRIAKLHDDIQKFYPRAQSLLNESLVQHAVPQAVIDLIWDFYRHNPKSDSFVVAIEEEWTVPITNMPEV